MKNFSKAKLKEQILSYAADDLNAIENALKSNLHPHVDLVSSISKHILFSGGKRLRPLLAVLSARLCGYTDSFSILFSTVFEYLHAATILHDDVIDAATKRRGKTSAHIIYGNAETILTGDFLLARALHTASETNKMGIIKLAANVTATMSQGEIIQLLNQRNLKLSEEQYLDIIFRKTAALIQAACQSGAILADASKDQENALSLYGINIGMAFQIADDLLDYLADTKILGKSIGVDLREGKLTLPVIYALQKATEQDKAFMTSIISNERFSFIEFEKFVDLLKKYNGIQETQAKAKNYIEKAKNNLSLFPDNSTRYILLTIADYVLARES